MSAVDQVLLVLDGILPAAVTVGCVVAEMVFPTAPGSRSLWPSSWVRKD